MDIPAEGLPPGYELIYNDFVEATWQHHTLAPPIVDTPANLINLAGAADAVLPIDAIQSLAWTLVGLKIHAIAEPQEIEGGDDDTFFVVKVLCEQAHALTSAREERAMTLVALATRHRYDLLRPFRSFYLFVHPVYIVETVFEARQKHLYCI